MSKSANVLIWCLIIFFCLTAYKLLKNKVSNSQKHEALAIAYKPLSMKNASVQLLGQYHDLVITENPFIFEVEPEHMQGASQVALKLTKHGSLVSGVWKSNNLAPEHVGNCKYSSQENGKELTVVFENVYKPTCEVVGGDVIEKI